MHKLEIKLYEKLEFLWVLKIKVGKTVYGKIKLLYDCQNYIFYLERSLKFV
jgi:hypothetical protein